MGFLSGVLGAVKDDEAVKTYDKKDENIETVINTLTTNIGSGRDGLVESVEQVKEWLEGYDDEVKNINKNVIGPIKTIETGISSLMKSIENWENEEYDKAINLTKLENWFLNVNHLPGHSAVSLRKVDDLDPKLQNDLNRHLAFINSAVKTFVENANRDRQDLAACCDNVNKNLNALEHQVNTTVKHHVDVMKRSVTEGIQELDESVRRIAEEQRIICIGSLQKLFIDNVQCPIESVQQALADVHKDLYNWGEKVKSVLDKTLKKCDKIIQRIDVSKNPTLHQKAKDLKDEAIKLLKAYDNAKGGIKSLVSSTRNKIEALDSNFSTALRTLKMSLKDDINKYFDKLFRDAFSGGSLGEVATKLGKLCFADWLRAYESGLGKNSIRTGIPDSTVLQRSLSALSRDATGNGMSLDKSAYGALEKDIKDKIDTKLPDKTNPASLQSGPNQPATEVDVSKVSSLQQYGQDKSALTLEVDKFLTEGFEKHFKAHITTGNWMDVMKLLDVTFENIKMELAELIQLVTLSDGEKGVKTLLVELNKLITDEDAGGLYGLHSGLGHIFRRIGHILGNGMPPNPNTKEASVSQILKNCETFYVETINDKITFCITQVRKSLNYQVERLNSECLTPAAKSCENAISKNVTDESSDAKNSIKKVALKNFVTTKIKELNDLKKLVTKELAKIENIIFTNQTTGLKGLMNTISSNLQAYVDPLRYPSVKDLSKQLELYYNALFTFTTSQTKSSPSPSSQLVAGLQTRTHALLTHLHANNRPFTFDSKFRSHFHDLTTALSTFDPALFANPQHPQLLDALKGGMEGLVKEMEKAYVNRYDGGKGITWTERKDQKDELTDDAKRCAKVFMSCLPMWVEDLEELKRRCEGSWRGKAIHLKDEYGKVNSIGEFFKQCGYSVPTSQTSHQDGELQCSRNMKGENIHSKIVEKKINDGDNIFEHLKGCDSNKKHGTETPMKSANFDISDILSCLYHHVNKYNDACHLSTLTSRRHPCSVYEMLVWLSGLPHNPIYSATRDERVFEILEELNTDDAKQPAEEEHTENGDILQVSYLNPEDVSLNAHPRKIPYKDVCDAVTYICANAYDVLTTIAGTGDESTTYASDLSNNSMKFHYPQSGEDCFDMLLDILRRLFPPLKFLLGQCSNAAYNFGWRDCMYGKDIASGKSQCIDHSEDKAACQPKDKAKDQPKCQVNSQANCRPTSPLMSYLNDCLPGHLPHQLSKIGCKFECSTCPSTSRNGMPCLTPLGFRGFSGSTRTGKDLCSMLTKFLSNKYVYGLFCLTPKPPKTLPEHFAFAIALVKGWAKITHLTPAKKAEYNFQLSFESSIRDASIDLYSDSYDLIKALTKAYGSQSVFHEDCKYPHLVNFTSSDICRYDIADVTCAPYLQSLCADSYEYMAIKHCDLYLSWAIYLSWDFWRLLSNLYNDFCNIFCADWGCRGCLRGDTCKKGSHGLTDEKSGNPRCQCPSIVDCNGVTPTLYRYGFGFCDAVKLNDDKYKKKCSDFCSQLNKVLNSQYFKDLFTECDNFIWTIREPFTYLVLALWSLSLFYLICVMVGRLDVLHIRSHLRIPSSHKITAQSLLAAAQVGRLAKISYLQP